MNLQEKDFYDYKTELVNGSDVVDLHRTGTSFYDDFLSNDKHRLDYLKNKKNLVGKVVRMSPEEYYQACSDYGFPNSHPSVEHLKADRRSHSNTLEHLKDVLTVYKHKFPMPYINKADSGQEGLHRMMVIGDMFGWNHKVPVLIVDWYDKQRAIDEARMERIRKLESRIRIAVRDALRYNFSNIEELKEQIQWELDKEFDYDDSVNSPVKFELTSDEQSRTFKVTVGEGNYTFDYDDVTFVDSEDDLDEDEEVVDFEANDLEDIDDFMTRYFGDNWTTDYKDTYNKIKSNFNEDIGAVETDNQGNELSKEQVEFFKNSKVRDKNGKLMLCYHGSAVVFTTFDKTKIRNGNSLGRGFYFSSEAATSSKYTKEGGEVKQVYLNIKNPVYFTITGAHQEFLVELALKYDIPHFDKNHKPINLNNYVSEFLQEKGYDGVIAYIPSENKFEIVVYEPEQVKSITNKMPTNRADVNEEVD